MSAPVDVHILDTLTGETRVYTHAFPWGEGSDYLWSEGNYGCDCNRHLFFCRAIDAPEDEDRPCGFTRYLIHVKDRETGAALYEDDDWASHPTSPDRIP